MTDDSTKADVGAPSTPGAPSADQQAVIDYLASDTYAHRQQQVKDGGESIDEVFSSLDPGNSPAISYCRGMLALCGIVILFAVLTPIGMEITEAIFNRGRPNYIVMMLIIQSISIPAIIAFSFATVTPMFWYGSVVVRFVTGILCVIPGCIAFYIGVLILEHGPPDDFWVGFSGVMFAQFLTAGTVALIVQMWTPWTLSHARGPDTPLTPPGTRAMLELTCVAAVGFAVFVSMDKGEIMEGLLFFTAVGLLSSLAVISVLIAFLRERNRNVLAASLAGFFAFATAFLFAGFFAVVEFGWNSIPYNFFVVSAVSLYGGALIFGVMRLCILALRSSGWRCVHREEERARSDSS